MKQNKFDQILNRISLEEIVQYYELDNHTFNECLVFFDVSQTMFFRVLKHYNYKKPNSLHTENIKKSKLEKYGDVNYNNRDKAKETCLEKYGVDNPFKDVDKIKQSLINKYGVDSPMKVEEIKQKVLSNKNYVEINKKSRETYFKKTGYDNPAKNPEVMRKAVETRLGKDYYTDMEKTRKTCQERYGVDFPCQRPEARVTSSNNSVPNKLFADLLITNNISFEREFNLENRSFDFKIDNILIEINPFATHNTTWSPFNRDSIDKKYHHDKSLLAKKYNYRCIHIFDWDNTDKIISLLKSREKIFARKCEIKEVPKKDAIEFINKYHLQNYAKDLIRLGLYHNNTLVSIMTFNKPRYNKNYEYEIIRYCSSHNVIGGAHKLFKYFIDKHNVQSMITYNDFSKFSGAVYEDLGFKQINVSIGKHWLNTKTFRHITDNLLRQRGADQLLGTRLGKDASNRTVMLENNYVEIYDAGQNTYVFLK